MNSLCLALCLSLSLSLSVRVRMYVRVRVLMTRCLCICVFVRVCMTKSVSVCECIWQVSVCVLAGVCVCVCVCEYVLLIEFPSNISYSCDALDATGDESDMETRRKCFQEVEVLALGVVDFEGFLRVNTKLKNVRSISEKGERELTRSRRHLRRLSVVEKLKLGIF